MDLKVFQINIVANSGISAAQLVDYRHIGLFKKTIMNKGLLEKLEFYQFFENNVYSNLIVEENYSYIEQVPLYLGKITEVRWYDLEDNIAVTESFTYMFVENEIIEFGINKRSNVMSNAKLYSFNQLGQNAFTLLDNCISEISTYIQGNTPPLVAKVNTQVGIVPGLTQTIANNINSILQNL